LQFAGRFSEIAGRANPVACQSSNYLNALGEFSRLKEQGDFLVLQGRFWVLQGRFWELQGEEQRGIANGWARVCGRNEQKRGLTLWRDSPRSRCARNPQSLQIVTASEKRLARHARGIESS
jgi:hypothetical protein